MKRCIAPNLRTIVAATLFSLPFTVAPAFAEQPLMGEEMNDASSLWANQDLDTKILSNINFANLREIKVAKLVLRKAVRQDVRSFATRLERDHRKANRQVVALAALLHRQLLNPIAETVQERREMRQEQRLLRRLERMDRKDFDGQYLLAMEKHHVRLIKKLQSALPRLGDAQTRKHVVKLLPMLKKHLAMARLLQARSEG